MNENIRTEDDVFTADSVAHGSSSVGAAMNRVKSCLNYSLKQKYGVENDEISEAILRVHGLSKKNLEFINNFESLVESKAEVHSDESEETNIDQNSNKSDVSVSGILNENATPISKLLGYRYLYRKMVELYGKQRAKFLCGEMYDYSLALADSSNILKPYCFSVNMSRLVLEGRPFGKLHSLPPHRVSSYIACLNETVHQLSNHTAGALAIATLFLDCARVMLFEEHKTLFRLKHNRRYRKYMRNCLQNFVHSMNHLSRNSTESPFSNVSIFDKPKLRGLLDEDNFGWYFDLEKKPKDFATFKLLGKGDWTEYCVDVISEIQDIFMDIMDAGDVARNGLPITFPVTTCLPPEEKIIVNDSIKEIGGAFKDFEYGWTDVEGLYTRDENGNQVAINKVFRGKSDNFVKIKTYGKGREFVVTPDHLCVLEDGTKVKAQDLKENDRLAYVIPKNDVFEEKKFIDVCDFIEDPVLLGYQLKYKLVSEGRMSEGKWGGGNKRSYFPKSTIDQCSEDDFKTVPEIEYVTIPWGKAKSGIKRYLTPDFDLGFYIGLFFAEGHFSPNYNIGFSFNKNESKLIDFVTNKTKELCPGISVRTKLNENNAGCQVIMDVAVLGRFLEKFTGHLAANKVLDINQILKYNREFAEGILTGIIAGDGSVNEWSVSTCSVSNNGMASVQALSSLLGIGSSLRYGSEFREGDRAFGSDSTVYTVTFSKKEIANMISQHADYYPEKFGRLNTDVTMMTTCNPIVKKIEFVERPNTDVFNIEVDNEHHTYMLPSGIVTSNCNITIDDDRKIVDPAFVKKACKHDIFRYNIFVSQGNKIASCCFTGDQMFSYYGTDGKLYYLTFKEFAEKYVDGVGEKHLEDVGTVIDPNTGEKVPITGVICMNNDWKRIITLELEDGSVIKATPNQKFFDNNSKTFVMASEIYEHPERYDI